VQVFFVISGYLITTLIMDEQRATGRLSLRAFYVRRALRILPASYVFLACMTLAGVAGLITWGPGQVREVLVAAVYGTNMLAHGTWPFGHLWSLAIEEQFYLLWPFMLVWLGTAASMRAALAVAVLSAPLLAALQAAGSSWFGTAVRLFPFAADAIAAGCVLAAVLPWLRRTGWIGHRVFTSGAGHLIPLLVIAADVLRHHPRLYYGLIDPLQNAGICYALARYTSFPDDAVARALNGAPMRAIGRASYSLYLWQQPFLNPYGAALLQSFPLNLLASVLAAGCSYRLIEMPMLRLRGRFRPVVTAA
jgi:peptidoglycan/LPS O-acetylase OafA/YrhL